MCSWVRERSRRRHTQLPSAARRWHTDPARPLERFNKPAKPGSPRAQPPTSESKMIAATALLACFLPDIETRSLAAAVASHGQRTPAHPRVKGNLYRYMFGAGTEVLSPWADSPSLTLTYLRAQCPCVAAWGCAYGPFEADVGCFLNWNGHVT